MQTDSVIIEGGKNEVGKVEDTKLMAPPIEDDLDFDQIHQAAKDAKKSKIVVEQQLTQSDLRAIKTYINDMSRYIKKYAAAGKMSFQYDCSKVATHCFLELARQFKKKYPRFFVVTQMGTQILTVDWSNKHEV